MNGFAACGVATPGAAGSLPGRISLAIALTPASGTAAIVNNQIVYTPNADFFGSDYFTYTITDGLGQYSEAYVDVSVEPVKIGEPPNL